MSVHVHVCAALLWRLVSLRVPIPDVELVFNLLDEPRVLPG